MDVIELIEVLERRARQICRDESDPSEAYTNDELKQRLRFHKHTVHLILQLIISDLDIGSTRNQYISPVLQIKAALRFYAIGNFQTPDGDLIGLSQPSVYRIIKRVSTSITRKKLHFIKFSSEAESQRIKQQFGGVSGIPGTGTIGCIDCSHIPVVSPGGEDAELFPNQKGYFSINVQTAIRPTCNT